MGSSVFSVDRRARSFLIVPRLILAGASAALLAACSSDTSRLAENPFGASSDRMATGSTQNARPSNLWLPSADVGSGSAPAQVASQPFTPSPAPGASAIQSSPLPPPTPNPSFSAPAASSPRLAAASPAAARAIPTGTSRNLAASGNWSPEGGTPIVVAQGETAAMLSTRYGVPTASLLAVNGMSNAAQIQPGTRLVVPVYNATRAATKPAAAAAPAKPTASAAPVPAAKPEKLRLVQGAQATQKPAGQPAKAAAAPAAKPAAQPVKAAEAARTPAKPAEAPRKQEAAAQPAPEKPAKPVKQAKAEPAAPASAPAADPEPVGSVPSESASGGSKPEFRWPARGRIIQGFKKGSSDGINIAVPEGTPVKAAESGVVAYAGSELKGYGNLVLIRHPNGYVSAYAHNGSIAVKRGEQIRRGQTIAKSGKSGNVASPQVHFELRKGSTPVDPTEYLAGM